MEEVVVICSVQSSTPVALWVLGFSATLILHRYTISVALISNTHYATRVEDWTEQITTSSIKYPSRNACHLTIGLHPDMISYLIAMILCTHNAAKNTLMFSQSISYHWNSYTDMLPYEEGKGTKQYGWLTEYSSSYANRWSVEPNNSGNNEDYPQNDQGGWSDATPEATSCKYSLVQSADPSSSPTTVPSSCFNLP